MALGEPQGQVAQKESLADWARLMQPPAQATPGSLKQSREPRWPPERGSLPPK